MMQFSMPRKIGLIGLLLLGMAPMMGCLTATTAASIEQKAAVEACRTFPPLSYDSKLDTSATVKGNRAHNRAHKAYCAGLEQEKK